MPTIDLKDWELERGAEAPDLSREEMDDRQEWIKRLVDAQQVRDGSHPEFDDMDYLTWYLTNQQADNAYLPPKRNSQDVRIVTGVTHEKGNTLLSALLNYNFEAAFVPFDNNDSPLYELGESMSSLVKKSRELEDWDRKRPYVYRELLAQGTVNVLETWFEERVRVKTVEAGWAEGGFDTAAYKAGKDEIQVLPGRGEAVLLTGTKVYYGDIRQPDISKQPFVVVLEQMPWSTARAQFAGWSRWKNVPKKISNITNDTQAQIAFRDWTLLTARFDYVEIARCFDKPNNCFQILINGIPMLPPQFPLTEVSPSGEYPIAKGDAEVMPFYVYAKSVPSKTKVEQGVLDEMLKLAVLKTQQSFMPPMANNTGKQFRRSMLFPATVHNDIDPTKLVPIIQPTGVQPAEMQFMQYLKSIMDSKSINAAFEGDQPNQKQTATEVIELKKAQIMKLGQAVWGIVQLERQMAWLRNWNHIANMTKPLSERYDADRNAIIQTWRSFTVNDKLDNGQDGLKVISFDKTQAQNATEPQIMAEEKLMSKKYRKPTRIFYIDPDALKNAKLTWHCAVTPTEEGTTELERVLFIQNIKDAAAIFGPQSLNFGYLKERFASYMKEDADKFFAPQQAAPAQPGAPGQPGAPAGPGQPQPNGGVSADILTAINKQGAGAAQQPGLRDLMAATGS